MIVLAYPNYPMEKASVTNFNMDWIPPCSPQLYTRLAATSVLIGFPRNKAFVMLRRLGWLADYFHFTSVAGSTLWVPPRVNSSELQSYNGYWSTLHKKSCGTYTCRIFPALNRKAEFDPHKAEVSATSLGTFVLRIVCMWQTVLSGSEEISISFKFWTEISN